MGNISNIESTILKIDVTPPEVTLYKTEDNWVSSTLSVNTYESMNSLGKIYGATKQDGYVSFDGENDYIDLDLGNYDFNETITMRIKFKGDKGEKNQEFFNNFETAGV